MFMLPITTHEQFKHGKFLPFSGNSGWYKDTQGFPKIFGIYLFTFVEFLSNGSPKMKTINFENYIPILTIISYRNWLDPLLPLNYEVLTRFGIQPKLIRICVIAIIHFEL